MLRENKKHHRFKTCNCNGCKENRQRKRLLHKKKLQQKMLKEHERMKVNVGEIVDETLRNIYIGGPEYHTLFGNTPPPLEEGVILSRGRRRRGCWRSLWSWLGGE